MPPTLGKSTSLNAAGLSNGPVLHPLRQIGIRLQNPATAGLFSASASSSRKSSAEKSTCSDLPSQAWSSSFPRNPSPLHMLVEKANVREQIADAASTTPSVVDDSVCDDLSSVSSAVSSRLAMSSVALPTAGPAGRHLLQDGLQLVEEHSTEMHWARPQCARILPTLAASLYFDDEMQDLPLLSMSYEPGLDIDVPEESVYADVIQSEHSMFEPSNMIDVLGMSAQCALAEGEPNLAEPGTFIDIITDDAPSDLHQKEHARIVMVNYRENTYKVQTTDGRTKTIKAELAYFRKDDTCPMSSTKTGNGSF